MNRKKMSVNEAINLANSKANEMGVLPGDEKYRKKNTKKTTKKTSRKK